MECALWFSAVRQVMSALKEEMAPQSLVTNAFWSLALNTFAACSHPPGSKSVASNAF